MDVYYCLPAGELWVRPAGYIHLVWGPGSQDSAAARVVFEELLRLLQVTGCGKLLTDQRQRFPATEEYMGWLLADWLTQVGAGRYLKWVAIVTAKPLDLRLQAIDVGAEAQRRYGIISRFFSFPEVASQWLQEPELPASHGLPDAV